MQDLDWPSHTGFYVQGGEDRIDVVVTRDENLENGGGPTRIGLQSDPGITWTKKIRVMDGDIEVASLSTQDDEHGPVWVDLPSGTHLELCKGKMFNVVTGMYRVGTGGSPFIPGAKARHILFIWKKD